MRFSPDFLNSTNMQSKPRHILVTGGAGFIGSHLVDELIRQGYRVRILDNLEQQIHPHGMPSYINPRAEFIQGDIRERTAMEQAVKDVDAIFHFAAAVGTGQSMYQIEKYTSVNLGGLSLLLDILVNTKHKPKIIFPGSATAYGECAHRCHTHDIIFPDLRQNPQLIQHQWDVLCPHCDKPMEPVPIPEEQPLCPMFVYGVQKKSGEELLRAVATTYDIPFSILRFFNVYGPRQALTNPYTGVIAIFSARIMNGKPPIVIEDGQESRDFTSVHDIVQACMLALKRNEANGKTFNVGTGIGTPIVRMAEMLLKHHNVSFPPVINGEFRKNDFRHSIANISKISVELGYKPRVTFAEGLHEFFAWAQTQEAIDQFEEAYEELRSKGLV